MVGAHTHMRAHFYVLSSEGAFFHSLRQSKKTRLEGGDLRISATFILFERSPPIKRESHCDDDSFSSVDGPKRDSSA